MSKCDGRGLCGITRALVVPLMLPLVLLAGCNTTEQTIATGTAILGTRPANELEQIYYLGSFDPRGQIPPTIYRIRVRGQSSAFSNTKFASGWVPAALVDSLNSEIGFKNGSVTLADKAEGVAFNLNRRLMQFGPEGFREAPVDHRLVIVMGVDPSNYFQAVDLALGQVAGFESEQSGQALKQTLFGELIKLQGAENKLLQQQQKVELKRQARAATAATAAAAEAAAKAAADAVKNGGDDPGGGGNQPPAGGEPS